MTEQVTAKSFMEYFGPMLAEKKSPEEIIELSLSGVDKLATALAGLTEADLDLSRADGKWSIRQTVHHIVDGDDIFSLCIKSLIGNPGGTFVMDWYDQDPWVQTMDY